MRWEILKTARKICWVLTVILISLWLFYTLKNTENFKKSLDRCHIISVYGTVYVTNFIKNDTATIKVHFRVVRISYKVLKNTPNLKGQSREIFDLWFFRHTYNTPGSTEPWATAVLNIDLYSLSYSTTKICFNFILLPWSRQDHQWPFYCYTVALTAVTKAETLILWFRPRLCAMQHGVKFFDSALCCTEWIQLRVMNHSVESRLCAIRSRGQICSKVGFIYTVFKSDEILLKWKYSFLGTF
jgi:hypothetical protein